MASMGELLQQLHAKQNAARQEASEDDVRRAVAKLKGLGSGFGLMQVGKTTMVLSVPVELDNDHAAVMEVANRTSSGSGAPGEVTVESLASELGWPEERARRAVERLVAEGMAWVDSHGGRTSYWFMSFWLEERLRTPPAQSPPLGPPVP